MRERLFRYTTASFAFLACLLLLCVLFSLVMASQPSIEKFGLGFLTSSAWDPLAEDFGALPAIMGTISTSFIAIVIGVPTSFGMAIFIVEMLQERYGRIVRLVIDLMAGIPSIIYGMWGLLVLAPFLSEYIQPNLTEWLGPLPFIGHFFIGPPLGIGVFTAGLILSLMIIPYIASTLVELLRSVPVMLRESAYGVGATRYEVICKVLIPYIRRGCVGSVMLGLGRALGETMAVAFVIGNAKELTSSLFMPGTTISASIANEFNEATSKVYSASLLELGVILFVISFLVLAISRLFLVQFGRKKKRFK